MTWEEARARLESDSGPERGQTVAAYSSDIRAALQRVADDDDQFMRQQQMIGQLCEERDAAFQRVAELEGLIVRSDPYGGPSSHTPGYEDFDALKAEARRIREREGRNG